jgi:hypothetical protein
MEMEPRCHVEVFQTTSWNTWLADADVLFELTVAVVVVVYYSVRVPLSRCFGLTCQSSLFSLPCIDFYPHRSSVYRRFRCSVVIFGRGGAVRVRVGVAVLSCFLGSEVYAAPGVYNATCKSFIFLGMYLSVHSSSERTSECFRCNHSPRVFAMSIERAASEWNLRCLPTCTEFRYDEVHRNVA